MSLQLLVAGGGIGGLAAALAASLQGADVRLLEKATRFSEVGAGIQLGPNVVRLLQGWGLQRALDDVAAFPVQLRVRDAQSGQALGQLKLAGAMAERYGAPYVTLHRADLHGLLLAAALQAGTDLQLGREVDRFEGSSQDAHGGQRVIARTRSGGGIEADALVAADGLWSGIRQQLLGDGPPRKTGHLAYRALVPMVGLPHKLRVQDITVWMGPRMHVVHYPVRRGELLNIVAFIHGELAPGEVAGWDHAANATDLRHALSTSHGELQALVQAVVNWRLWPVYDRSPMTAAHQHAQGRVALLGDAAHPMRPYLAQGAGMAIEDAAALGSALGFAGAGAAQLPAALQRYAHSRWQRNARVQSRALRNGQIFHASGLVGWARDVSMKVLGEKLLDMPWLYGGSGSPPRGDAGSNTVNALQK